MGFWEWMGFENPRDSPKTEQPKEGLPQVTDNVRDSGQTFVFGRSNAGEQVDEKAAMQIPTVYACVRLLAESIAALPLHLYRVTDDNGNKEKARDHPLYKILYRQPNPEMTSFVFWETLMTHLLLWGNAYAQIVRDGKNTVLGLYPLLPENVEVDRDESGELYYIYHAYTDEVPGEQNKDIYFRRDEIFHVPGLGFNGLIGFSPIAMMKNSLGTSIVVDKYGSSFFKNGAQPGSGLRWCFQCTSCGCAGRGPILQTNLPAAGGQPVFGNEAVFRDGDLPYLPCASASGGGLVQSDLLQH